MAKSPPHNMTEAAASESKQTGEHEWRNQNQRRARNKQKRKLEAQHAAAAAAQAATPLTQPTAAVQEAHLPISDGGPGIAPTVPEVVDCEPFHPITPTANNIATTGPESNTHGNVRGSPSTRRVDGAQNTATGTATMATTSGVAKPKRKAWKHRKPKKAVIAKEADQIKLDESSAAQPESSKNQTGQPRLDIKNGKAKTATHASSKPPASEARPKAGRLVNDSRTKLDLAGTKRKRDGELPPPSNAMIADWQEFRHSMGVDKRTATGSGSVRLHQPTAADPPLSKGKGKGKRKGKGKGKGKGKEKEKELAIKGAADKWSDRQHLDEAQGSARLATLPTSTLPFPFITPDQNHNHTHHHSTTFETGELTAIAEDSEFLVPTQGDMPASTRGMITPCKPCRQSPTSADVKSPASSVDRYSTRPTHASRQSGVHLDKFDAPPAERNTRGFQPPRQSQVKQQTSTSPTSASALQPRSTTSIPVGITEASSIADAHTPPVIAQGANTKITSALQDDAQSAKVKDTRSGTGQIRVQNLRPTRQTKQAAVVKASGHDELYGASDEDPPSPNSQAIQPTDEAGKPNRDSRPSRNPVSLTPVPAATPHINLNALPQYAWNKGINPKYQMTPLAIQQTTAFASSPTEPARSGVETDNNISAKKAPRHFEQGRADEVNEVSFISKQRSKVVPSIGPADPSGEDNRAGDVKHTSVGVQEVTGQLEQAHGETIVYTPPHLRVPKSKLDPSKPSTASLTFSPEGNKTPSHVASPSTTVVTQSQHAAKAPETVEPDHSHLPPHMRPPKVKKLSQIEPNADPIPHSAVGNNNSAGEEVTPAKTTTASVARPYAKGKERVSPNTYEEKPNIRGGDLNGSRDLSDTTRRRTRMEKMMRDKGYSPPPKGRIPVIGNWETVERTWEERDPHDYDAPEHQSHLHEWSGRIAQEIGEEPVVVDTSAPGFAMGTYVPVEGRLESAVSEDAHETYRLDDPYTERKSNQTAQAAIEALLKKKRTEEPEQPAPTKAQKLEARALQRERQLHFIEMERNHPNKPVADIYIRPAEEKDLGAMAEIFNWYIKSTAATVEIQPKTIATMRELMQETREEGFDMYVAVQRSGRSGANGHNHRVVSEPICGFTYANDLAGQNHSYIYTAELFVYASHDHPHVGIGRCLFDRMMDLLDINYAPKGGCEWRGEQLLTRREIKKVQVNIPYWDKVEADNEDLQWKGNWLTGQGVADKYFMKFVYQGTLAEIGWKQKKTISVAQFLHDTLIDISRKPDNIND